MTRSRWAVEGSDRLAGRQGRRSAEEMPGRAVGRGAQAGGIAPRLGAGRGLAPLDSRAERVLERDHQGSVAPGVELGQARAVDRAGAERQPRLHLGAALVVEWEQLEEQCGTKAFARWWLGRAPLGAARPSRSRSS